MNKSVGFPTLIYGLAIAGIVQPGRAETLAFDPISIGADPSVGDYSVGALAGQNPFVSGFNSAWANASVNTTAAGLTYSHPNYRAATGGALQHVGAGRAHRSMEPALADAFAGTGTVYFGFLGKFGTAADNGAWGGYAAVEVGSSADADASKTLAVGVDNSAVPGAFMYQINNGAKVTLTTTSDTSTHLFLVRFNMSTTAASDSVTIWVDPDLSGNLATDPPGGTTVSGLDLLAISNLRFGAGGTNNFLDEIRFGSTLKSMLDGPAAPLAPIFVSHPTDKFGFVGSTVTLSASAPAVPEPNYKWEYSVDGSDPWKPIPGAESSVLEIPAAPYTANGYYRVVATNPNGSEVSNIALVDLDFPPPTITRQPLSAFVAGGSTVELSVEATGFGTLSYQWFKDDLEMMGQTSPTLNLGTIDASDVAEYYVSISDDAAEHYAEVATLAISNIVVVGINEDPLLGSDSVLTGADPSAGQYAVGAVAGQSPVVPGFTAAWINGGVEASATGLTYATPNYGGIRGGSLLHTAAASRPHRAMTGPLLSSFGGGGTVYWSFLGKFGTAADNAAWGGYAAVEVGSNADNDAGKALAIGVDDSQVPGNFMYQINNGTKTSLGLASDTGTHLFLVRFDLSSSAASDAVTMWIDPNLSGGLASDPPSGLTVGGLDLFAISNIRFGAGGTNNAADEIRFGTTLQAVISPASTSQTFASWIAQYPGVGAENGFGADPDRDGLANGLESFLGTNPGTSNPGLVQVAASGGALTFQHPRNQNPPSDVIGTYVWSTDLVTWHADGATSNGTTVSFAPNPNTPAAGTTTVTTTQVGTSQPKLFVRLKATSAP